MMSDSSANFSLTSNFNSNFDITWSFQYSVTGISSSNGGFCTFLYNNTSLTSGGSLSGLGFAPYNNIGGVSGAIIGVMFTSDNKITIKSGTSFNTLTSFTLFESLSPLVKTYEDFNTIRFNLTDVAQNLKISLKDKILDEYIELYNINTGLTGGGKDFYKIGFSYSTPLTSNTDKITIKLKDFHVHGQERETTNTYMEKPFNLPITETFYIIQSPTSAYIDIGPDSIGSLLHNSEN